MTQAKGGLASSPEFLTPFARTPGVHLTASAAQVAALAVAGTPVPPGAVLIDPVTRLQYGQSDGLGGYSPFGGTINILGVEYLRLSDGSLLPLVSDGYQGKKTLAAVLALTGSEGMWANVTDIVPGDLVRVVNNGTKWRLAQTVRMRTVAAAAISTAAQYITAGRFGPPAGAFALCGAFELMWRFSQPNETNTITSYRIKLGSAGTAADVDILASVGNPLAGGDNQRSYRQLFSLNSATQVQADGASNTATPGFLAAAGTGLIDPAFTLNAAATTAQQLYLGIDMTNGVSATDAVTVTSTLILMP